MSYQSHFYAAPRSWRSGPRFVRIQATFGIDGLVCAVIAFVVVIQGTGFEPAGATFVVLIRLVLDKSVPAEACQCPG